MNEKTGTADRKLSHLRSDIADHLVEISKLFNRPYKLTIVCRNPARPDGEMNVIVSDDDMDEVIAAVAHLKQREAMR